MHVRSILALAALAATTASFFGCSEEPPPPDFVPGTVETRTEQAAYPEGPYGVGQGSIIPNLAFWGYANPMAQSDVLQVLQLADFYNPHGRDPNYKPASAAEDDRLFPAGSQYGEGLKKPTVLAIDVASVWCGPCKAEAQCVLPVHHRVYSECGGGLFLQLQDGATPGEPATSKNLYNWTVKSYKVDFPSAIDPLGRLGIYFAANAFPQNFIIDLTTMKIEEVLAGVPDETYWKKYESFLLDPSCPSQQPTCTTNDDCADIPGTTCSTTCPANPATCILHACQAAGCKNQ